MDFMSVLPYDARVRLLSNLAVTERGCDTDLVSPLVPSCYGSDLDKARSIVLSEFASHCKLGQLPMWLREVETSAGKKVGTASKYLGYSYKESYDSLEAKINKYFLPGKMPHLQEKSCLAADRYVSGLNVYHGSSKLELCNLDEASMTFDNSKGLGWPVFSSKAEHVECVKELSKQAISDNTFGFLPALLGTRSVSAGPYLRAKTRVIYQCSRVSGNVEKMVFIPMFKHLRDYDMFSPWMGQRFVDSSVTSMFEDSDGPFLSVDYSNFDASVPAMVIDRIFGIIKSWFTGSSASVIDLVHRQFRDCSIIVPGGLLVDRQRGIPSGSVLTNMVGSLVNLWVMSYAAHRCGVTVRRSIVQGDDGVFSFNGKIDFAELASVIKSDLWMTMSVDKSYDHGDEIHFLSMVHRRSYTHQGISVGIRSLVRTLNGMMSYEKWKPGWNGYMDTLRWLQQLGNAQFHPCFDAACDFLRMKDKLVNKDFDEIVRHAGGVKAVHKALARWTADGSTMRIPNELGIGWVHKLVNAS